MQNSAIRIAAALTLVALGACSGGKAGSLPPSAPATPQSGPSAAPNGATRASLTIVVPHAGATIGASRRSPKYVSPSSAQLSVAVNTSAATTYGLTPSSPGCQVISGNTTCIISIVAPAGSDKLTLTLTDGTGNVLSHNVVTAQVASGVTTPVPITLAGVPAAVAVVPGANAVVDTTSSPYHAAGLLPQPIEIEPLDADGNIIIGPGAPVIDSVTVSAGSAYATVASAGTTDTAAYTLTPVDASAGGKTVTLSATAHGIPLSDGTTSAPITTTTQYLFTPAIALASGSAVYEYSLETSALTAAFSACAGGCLGATGVIAAAADPKGDLYVGYSSFLGLSVTSTIAIFPHNSTTSTNALGSSSGIEEIGGFAFDPDGDLWVADGAHGGFHVTYTPPEVEEFAPGGTSPITTLTNVPTQPGGVAVDKNGNVYVADSNNSNTVWEYAKGASGAAAPTAMIGDPNLALPVQLATDAAGGLYVADQQNDDIDYFAPGATTAATTTLQDSSWYSGIGWLMDDPQGALWVSISNSNETERLAPNALPGTANITQYLPQPGVPVWIP